MSALAAFESLFIPEPNSGCWLWLGGTGARGYGSFTQRADGFVAKRAHRASWILYRCAEITSKEHVLHKCDMPLCVNPEHLFIGTQKDNMSDMARKGRQAQGEKHGMFRHGKYVGDKKRY